MLPAVPLDSVSVIYLILHLSNRNFTCIIFLKLPYENAVQNCVKSFTKNKVYDTYSFFPVHAVCLEGKAD